MAILPENRSLTAAAIDAACAKVSANSANDSLTLRASAMGHECDRALWYALRWAVPHKPVEPRIQRIFDNGHDREARIVSYLKTAGLTVEEADPTTGKQWRVVLADGALTGSADGVVTGVPDAPVARHLLEIKTMNRKRWQDWRRKGVKASDPKYYTQMQIYMRGLGLTRALFVSECQDTKEIETERVKYDEAVAASIEARAARIFAARSAPERIGKAGSWPCNLCAAHDVCHGIEMPRRNCRTCIAVKPNTFAWWCSRHGRPATEMCDLHLYEPPMVCGDQVDFDEKANAVTYHMPNGQVWIDGQK